MSVFIGQLLVVGSKVAMDILKIKDKITGQWVDIPAIRGDSGVYYGSGPAPDWAKVWIDEGSPADIPAIPAGGTTGQVCTKASNADYDAEWTSPIKIKTVSQTMTVDGQSNATISLSMESGQTVLGVCISTHPNPNWVSLAIVSWDNSVAYIAWHNSSGVSISGVVSLLVFYI